MSPISSRLSFMERSQPHSGWEAKSSSEKEPRISAMPRTGRAIIRAIPIPRRTSSSSAAAGTAIRKRFPRSVAAWFAAWI